eukprot:TRINITY_DN40707_c0_g1_i1.p1 TRINITY_DN40707_c0_g1~~TRINITY_DN40707_c0_g1_i1.p1  ORF type:complete len:586 (+),score=132.98 TRINITY_DN40707_c0_g1_i1:138-1895(+)
MMKLLWQLTWLLCAQAIRVAVTERLKADDLLEILDEDEDNASAVDVGIELNFVDFSVKNNATFPLNMLALPSLLRVYATTKNGMKNDEVHEFSAIMGQYDLYFVIDDGSNHWTPTVQAGWGLMKDGMAVAVGMAVGAGFSGALATAAWTTATASLALAGWPAAVVTAGAWLAFGGAAVVTSLAATSLTEQSMELVALSLDKLKREKRPVLGGAGKDELFLFDSVVKSEEVRRLVEKTLPEEVGGVKNVMMTKKTAEGYFTALENYFHDKYTVRADPRHFIVTGGFVLPDPPEKKKVFGETLWRIDFVPLMIGEIIPQSGCSPLDKGDTWRATLERCLVKCGHKRWTSTETTSNGACEKACKTAFHRAADEEALVDQKNEERRQLKEKLINKSVTLSRKELLEAAAKAAHLDDMDQLVRIKACSEGWAGNVTSVDLGSLTATVVFEEEIVSRAALRETSVVFPLEVISLPVPARLLNVDGGAKPAAPVLTPSQRQTLKAVGTFVGRCWSRCETSGVYGVFKKTAKHFSEYNFPYCFAAREKERLNVLEKIFKKGAPCSSAEMCKMVPKSDTKEEEKSDFACTSGCW